ncbi:hypothetical protein SKAU_G00039410 [Synaphobranchus kaupii]|uniref:Secreted protein n=1 Tax=Synaphobranchus kaupii TaxID=118154 RepID=A0A9Q1GH07_SYNKA|nr:hypothetical protein SKAU_G00039410 [Synaphobranchus kaupii]
MKSDVVSSCFLLDVFIAALQAAVCAYINETGEERRSKAKGFKCFFGRRDPHVLPLIDSLIIPAQASAGESQGRLGDSQTAAGVVPTLPLLHCVQPLTGPVWYGCLRGMTGPFKHARGRTLTAVGAAPHPERIRQSRLARRSSVG